MPYGGNDWLALTQEATLEPEIPICDPHHHFWDFRSERIPYQRYLLHELAADVNCGGRIFPIRASQRGPPRQGPRCNPGRRHGQQVPGRVTVNRLAKGCSLPDPRGTENAVGQTSAPCLNQKRLRLVRKSPTIAEEPGGPIFR